MDTTIKLLRERTVLCRRIIQLTDDLIDNLKNNSLDVLMSVQSLEKIIPNLIKNINDSDKYMTELGYKSLGDYINIQTDSIQKSVALNLLNNSGSLLTKLRVSLDNARKLNEAGKDFVVFNMNLISQTQANIYGANNLTESQNHRIVEFKC